MFRLKIKTRIKQANKNLAEISVAIVREKDYRSSPGKSPNNNSNSNPVEGWNLEMLQYSVLNVQF